VRLPSLQTGIFEAAEAAPRLGKGKACNYRIEGERNLLIARVGRGRGVMVAVLPNQGIVNAEALRPWTLP